LAILLDLDPEHNGIQMDKVVDEVIRRQLNKKAGMPT